MHRRFKHLLFLMFLLSFLVVCTFFVYPVSATPCAVLKVSLPEGVYRGYDVDPWLCECWFLNLTGSSQIFLVRINNTSSSLRSYDTHLIIALNEAGYNNLVSLVINGTNVPKSAFKWGTPKPYNKWTWPSGDVYPTWFNDAYIVGYIPKKGYVTLIVSAAFSDANGVRMHFDVYGKSTSGTVIYDSQIVHNPLGADSTVFLQAGPPPPQPPFAVFTYAPTYPEVNEVVTFDASGSYDPDGYIVTYTWNFGDGNITATSNPIITHKYIEYGDYSVKLTVIDNDGLTDDEIATIHVSQHPVAAFTFWPLDPLVHEVVTFDASASTPDGGVIVSYKWDFGDGNITTINNPIITHAYDTYGTFTVTLTVTDSEGKWDTESKQITVENAPVADFTWDPYYPQRGETVTFNASISAPDGGVIISYAWDFGDGTPIVEENDPVIIHVYAAAGDYPVTLNVTDSEGRWDIETKIITVVQRRYYLTVKTDPTGVTIIPGENWYSEGTEVTLTAPDIVQVSAGARYKFNYWDVDGTPKAGNPITVLMDDNHAATAHYILEYYLTVVSPFGTVGGEDWYPSGATAYATLDTGLVDHGNGTRRVFTHWSGDASGTNYAQSNPIIMNSPKTAVANWKTQYAVTFNQIGVPSDLAPIVEYTADTDPIGEVPFTVWVQAGSQISYTYYDMVLISQGIRYIVMGVSPPSPQVVNAPLTIVGQYQVQYYLTVRIDPPGITTIPGEGWYNPSQSVQLTAPTVAGYIFQFWDVDGIPKAGNPITVVMDAPHTATAHYTAQVITYKLKIETTAGGTTNPAPGTYNYAAGTQVQVTAVPSSGYIFDHWELNGTNVGTATTYTVTMNNNYNLKAFFKAATPPLTVSISPMSASIVVGQQVTFTSSVSGGTPSYTYQWLVNNNPVPGATSNSFTFTPTTPGTYYIVLKVTDAAGTIAQSDPARITVSSVPVGGYSIAFSESNVPKPTYVYVLLLGLFAAVLSVAKRKRK